MAKIMGQGGQRRHDGKQDEGGQEARLFSIFLIVWNLGPDSMQES